MAKRKHSSEELPLLLEKISELRLKGWTQAKIALEVGLTQQAVSHHLQRLDEEVLHRTAEHLELNRKRQIDSCLLRKAAAWKIYENSSNHRTQLAALDAVGKADKHISELNHLLAIAPANSKEESLDENSPEETAAAIRAILSGEGV